MAGIMGGEQRYQWETRHLFLEAAFFAPELMAGGRATMACTPMLPIVTSGAWTLSWPIRPSSVRRSCSLTVSAARRAGVDVTSSSGFAQRDPVTLKAASIQRMLGIDLAADEVTRIFKGLGLQVEATQMAQLALHCAQLAL